jgi:hypothetical protein
MLENLQPKTDERRTCKVGIVRAGLDEKDAQLLDQYLSDKERWSSHGLVKALDSTGISLSVATVIRHRKGECAC